MPYSAFILVHMVLVADMRHLGASFEPIRAVKASAVTFIDVSSFSYQSEQVSDYYYMQVDQLRTNLAD